MSRLRLKQLAQDSASNGQVLTYDSTLGVWKAATVAGGYTDPLTTKGDLVGRSSTTSTRLPVGTDGQVLTADSTQTLGVKWATPTSGTTLHSSQSLNVAVANQDRLTLGATPYEESVQIFVNGVLKAPGSGRDYTVSGSVITFATNLTVGAVVQDQYLTTTASPADSVLSSSFLPTSLSNLLVWFDASQISGATDGAAVGTWPDMSGGSHTASQGTGTKQPIYHSTGTLPNSKPIVTFDGVDDYLSFSASLGSATTLFMMCNPSSVASAYLLGGTGSGNTPAIISAFSSKAFEFFDSADRQTLATTATGYHVLSVVQTDGSNYSGWFDGASAFSQTPTVALSGKSLSTISSAGGTSNFGGFSVGEIVAYSRALTTTERQQVESYLKTKYATP